MSNAPTIKSGSADLLHAEATPHGVNIMTRNDAGGDMSRLLLSATRAP